MHPLTRPAFCMSLQATFLHSRTRPSFCMSLRTSAHTGVAIRIPAEKLGKLALLRANPYALSRIRLRRCSLLCAAAGSTDCHVASLLAMTVGEVLAPVDTPCLLHTLRAPRPCTRAHVPAFCMSLRAASLQPLTPGMFPRTLRTASLHPRTLTRPLHVIASQCAHWRGNPFSLR